jgi:hypothetical protein
MSVPDQGRVGDRDDDADMDDLADRVFAMLDINVERVPTVWEQPRATDDKSLYEHACDFAERIKDEFTNFGIGGVAVTVQNHFGRNVPVAIVWVRAHTVVAAASFCRNFTTDPGRLSCFLTVTPDAAHDDVMSHSEVNQTLTLLLALARACAHLPRGVDLNYHAHPPLLSVRDEQA